MTISKGSRARLRERYFKNPLYPLYSLRITNIPTQNSYCELSKKREGSGHFFIPYWKSSRDTLGKENLLVKSAQGVVWKLFLCSLQEWVGFLPFFSSEVSYEMYSTFLVERHDGSSWTFSSYLLLIKGVLSVRFYCTKVALYFNFDDL